MKALLGIVVVASIAFVFFAMHLPSRIADLGSGNLDALVAPTTTVSFGTTVKLDGRGERPPLAVTATRAVPVRSATKGVRAGKGHVLLGVPLTVENVGRSPYDVRMGIEAGATDAHGASYRPSSTVTRLHGRHVLRIARVAPRAELHGVVVFEVPRGTTLTTASFTVGSGLTRTAAWTSESD